MVSSALRKAIAHGFSGPRNWRKATVKVQHEKRPLTRCKKFLGNRTYAMENAQKRAAVAGGFEVDNREASNRVDRSHSVSKEDVIVIPGKA